MSHELEIHNRDNRNDYGNRNHDQNRSNTVPLSAKRVGAVKCVVCGLLGVVAIAHLNCLTFSDFLRKSPSHISAFWNISRAFRAGTVLTGA